MLKLILIAAAIAVICYLAIKKKIYKGVRIASFVGMLFAMSGSAYLLFWSNTARPDWIFDAFTVVAMFAACLIVWLIMWGYTIIRWLFKKV